MSIGIYYFSGTGNSLFIAKELKKRLPDCSLVPVVHVLRNGRIETAADVIGIVFQIKGTKTEKTGRYHHMGITAEDIVHQK